MCFRLTSIMYQHTAACDIVGMVAVNVEVVDIDRCFKKLVLDFFNDDVLAVNENQNITCAKMDGIRPPLYRRIEFMPRR